MGNMMRLLDPPVWERDIMEKKHFENTYVTRGTVTSGAVDPTFLYRLLTRYMLRRTRELLPADIQLGTPLDLTLWI